jgi:ribosomal protein L22
MPQVLEEALKDAQQKQLDRSRLVVDRILATKVTGSA